MEKSSEYETHDIKLCACVCVCVCVYVCCCTCTCFYSRVSSTCDTDIHVCTVYAWLYAHKCVVSSDTYASTLIIACVWPSIAHGGKLLMFMSNLHALYFVSCGGAVS